jgi:hypothetical protein
MGDTKRRTLRIAAAVVALICLACQIFAVSSLWLSSDPGIVCGHQLSWSDWLDCLHETRGHVAIAEFAIVIWIIAGVSLVAGWLLPPYISLLLPIGVVAVVTFGLTEYWHNEFGIESNGNIFIASTGALTTGVAGVVVVAPIVAGWLWGFCNRGRREAALRMATAFE